MPEDPCPGLPLHLPGPLGENVRQHVVVGGRTSTIDSPDPAKMALDAGGHLPFWAALWPASRMLAEAILREPWTPGTEALELGCGLGLAGIIGLSVGLRVTFSDYEPTALRFAAENARLNGFHDFLTLLLDWHSPPVGLQVPVLLGSDLVYEVQSVDPLVKLINVVLAPGGICLLADQDRLPARALREAIGDSGMVFASKTARATDKEGRRVKGTVYRIQRPADSANQ